MPQSLPLLPDSGPRLVGIARLAAHGESVRQGHEVEYFTLPVKSLLNRCDSRRQMPFTWTINPYRGCEFACKYCYARYTHEFMEIRNSIEFEQKISRQNQVTVNFTVTTIDADLARILEPRAPRPDLRLGALRELRAAGIRTGVICAPVLPGITDAPRQLEAVVRAAAEAGASYIYGNPLFLKPCSAAVFLPFLKENFPRLVPEYEARFKDRAFLPAPYRKRISELFASLRVKYGFKQERWAKTPPQSNAGQQQLSLF